MQTLLDLCYKSGQPWEKWIDTLKINGWKQKNINDLHEYLIQFNANAFVSFASYFISKPLRIKGNASKILNQQCRIYDYLMKHSHTNNTIPNGYYAVRYPLPQIVETSYSEVQDGNKTYKSKSHRSYSLSNADISEIIRPRKQSSVDMVIIGDIVTVFETKHSLQTEYEQTLDMIRDSIHSEHNAINTLTFLYVVCNDGIKIYAYITDANRQSFGSRIFASDLIVTIPFLFEDYYVEDRIRNKIRNDLQFKPKSLYEEYDKYKPCNVFDLQLVESVKQWNRPDRKHIYLDEIQTIFYVHNINKLYFAQADNRGCFLGLLSSCGYTIALAHTLWRELGGLMGNALNTNTNPRYPVKSDLELDELNRTIVKMNPAFLDPYDENATSLPSISQMEMTEDSRSNVVPNWDAICEINDEKECKYSPSQKSDLNPNAAEYVPNPLQNQKTLMVQIAPKRKQYTASWYHDMIKFMHKIGKVSPNNELVNEATCLLQTSKAVPFAPKGGINSIFIPTLTQQCIAATNAIFDDFKMLYYYLKHTIALQINDGFATVYPDRLVIVCCDLFYKHSDEQLYGIIVPNDESNGIEWKMISLCTFNVLSSSPSFADIIKSELPPSSRGKATFKTQLKQQRLIMNRITNCVDNIKFRNIRPVKSKSRTKCKNNSTKQKVRMSENQMKQCILHSVHRKISPIPIIKSKKDKHWIEWVVICEIEPKHIHFGVSFRYDPTCKKVDATSIFFDGLEIERQNQLVHPGYPCDFDFKTFVSGIGELMWIQ
eukprot:264697_1